MIYSAVHGTTDINQPTRLSSSLIYGLCYL